MNRAPSPSARATLTALVTAVLAVTAAGAESPAAPPHWFATELAAVIDAARQYNPRSIREDREFMGAILRHDDCYTFTVGAGEPGSDRVSVRILVPEGAKVVAFWHTHGDRHHSRQYFSDVDTALVAAWQKRFYLADYTGVLKVMAPGAKILSRHRAKRLGLPPIDGYARGDVVADGSGRPIRIATRSPPKE